MTEMLNVAMIGQGFMGRSHSNAWGQVNKFFEPPIKAVKHTVYGMEAENPKAFAEKWEWNNASTDWEALVKFPEIGLVDIVTPNFMHAPPAKAAIAAGKPCACEKPIAGTLIEAREMAEAAKKAGVESFVWFMYRRVPAVALAHLLVKQGAIGDIRHHVRATYLQEWADESVPFAWRFTKEKAGSGAHGDLNAHIVDMTRFVTGFEVDEVCGAVAETFVKQRRIIEQEAAKGMTDEQMRYAKAEAGSAKMGDVTVDDAVIFLVKYNSGAIGSYEAARQATGNYNPCGFEINGTKGSLKFNFERMNELEFFDRTRPREVQGWTTVLCTNGVHPYAGHYWPDGHLIGYEHCFTSMAYDILLKLAGKTPTVPLADFNDGYQTQRVLEAAMICATEKRWVKLDEVK